MSHFLERLARALLDRHGTDLTGVAVVLPGQRAGLHLRRYLAQAAGTTIWSPEILDMGGWMQRFTGLRQLGTMEALLLLYEAHRQLTGERGESLDQFLQWAPIVLRDMSEADAHLLDLDDLYRDLRAYQAIEDWSFTHLGDDLSQGQRRALDHWQATGALHRKLIELMTARGMGTSGWIARQAAERPLRDALPWATTWFAGLNALDPATTQVLRTLMKNGAAQVAWDADHYYLDDTAHEAGRFLRRSMQDLGPGVLPPVRMVREQERSIRTVMVPDRTSQARFAAQYLAELPPEERERTAVVLADEDLLTPLLEALPADLGPGNVTMGVPVTQLAVNGLVDTFLDLHAQAVNGLYRVEDIRRLLQHGALHQGEITRSVVAAMMDLQRPRITADRLLNIYGDVSHVVPEGMAAALTPIEVDTRLIGERITELLRWARSVHGSEALLEEQLFRMARMQQRLHQALERSGIVLPDVRSYARARERLVRNEQIGFFGEALDGLQIMGFLETRSIDLEHILLLGANEGTLPQSSVQQSFIPFDIRRTYRLPLRADTEAITAYHTYRLLHQTKVLTAVSDQGGASEGDQPSRFLAQWTHELAPVSRTTVEPRQVLTRFAPRHAPVLQVSKDAALLARLRELAARGFSPSALGTWLRCPLDFHFTQVLRLRPPEEVDHKLGSDVLGDAVHGVLQDLITQRIGQPLTPEDLREWATGMRDGLMARLARDFPLDVLQHGHFRLRIDMAAKATGDHLLAEAERIDAGAHIIPLAVEHDLSAELVEGVRLRGRCDRIDRREGMTHILDIKTGSVPEADLGLPGLERHHLQPKHRYALQLLVYAWMYLTTHPVERGVKAGILPMQKASRSEGLYLRVGGNDLLDRSMLPAIGGLIAELVREVLDPEQPLVHDPDSPYCTCCVA